MDPTEWHFDGRRITDGDVLQMLRSIVERESPLIVEHRFYRGARAPTRFVCDDFDEIESYLRTRARPGDSLYFWNFEQCCTDANSVAHGKVPDADGRTPRGGAY